MYFDHESAPIRWVHSGRCSEAAGFHNLFCPDWMNYRNVELVWGSGGLGWKQIQAATLPQTHFPDPESGELSQVNALVIGCLGQFPEHWNKWLWFIVALGREFVSLLTVLVITTCLFFEGSLSEWMDPAVNLRH